MGSSVIRLGPVRTLVRHMAESADSKIGQIAENKLLTVIARLIIPPAAIAAISIGSYYLSQTSAKLDRIESGLQKAQTQDELFSQFIQLRTQQRDLQIGDINRQLGDHEGRIRILERRPPN